MLYAGTAACCGLFVGCAGCAQADQFLFSCGDLEDKLNEPLMVGQYDSLKAANEVFATSTTEAMDALTASYNELDALATELRVRCCCLSCCGGSSHC